ncbi:MAG TPA: hypothetical protein VK809_10600 [Bacteroidia bacterium]|jgi:hypothetical protein|nr:hypothetical protein [Bacteroidia bacterium]
MNTESEYIPGTCNIGPAEIKARRNVAVISTIVSIVIIILLVVLHADKLWRLTLFIPATSVAVSFQQVYFHFCVNFGLRGIFNFGDIGKTFTVDQQENFKKDRMKAQKMIATGIFFGLVIAVLFYILPV